MSRFKNKLCPVCSTAFKENDDSLYIMKAVADSEDTFDPVTDEEYDMFYQMYVQRVEQLEQDSQYWS